MASSRFRFAPGWIWWACAASSSLCFLPGCNPVVTEENAASESTASVDQDTEYTFVPEPARWVMVIQGEEEVRGRLDASGNFISLQRSKRGQPLSAAYPAGPIINHPQNGVYEYRSSRLIRGDIDKDGNFVPTVGEKVIDFKDYRYSPEAPKIYNLPGKFVRKGEQAEKK